LVSGNEHVNLPEPAQVQRDGELEGIEGAKHHPDYTPSPCE
jgi:hypothetical protein